MRNDTMALNPIGMTAADELKTHIESRPSSLGKYQFKKLVTDHRRANFCLLGAAETHWIGQGTAGLENARSRRWSGFRYHPSEGSMISSRNVLKESGEWVLDLCVRSELENTWKDRHLPRWFKNLSPYSCRHQCEDRNQSKYYSKEKIIYQLFRNPFLLLKICL